MDTLVIEDVFCKEQSFRSPVRPMIEPKKKSFEEAVAECNGISVDAFFDKLDERIKKRFNA